VITASKKRFLRGWEFDSEIENGESTWTWAYEILKQFEFLNGATGADIKETVISFTTRRIQEMRAAVYLTKHATPEDLVDTKVPKDCAQGHSGDRDWEELWIGTIRMPKRHQNEHKDRYRRAMEILFERPLRSQEQRRPTQWMWEVSRWVDPELDEHLRNHLGKQFAEILRGTDHRSEVARDLIDLKNFVILADPTKRIDRFDTGRFVMGGRQWDNTMVDKVPVELSKFGMCKYTLSNVQYSLFDDNFLETEQTWWFEVEYRGRFATWAGEVPKEILEAWHRRLEDFKDPLQPAVFLSWYDSYWYAEFVNRGLVGTSLERSGWKVLLPTEAQWEYGARAGGQEDYFRGKGWFKGSNVTEKNLSKYAHFGQPLGSGKPLSVRNRVKKANAWGMEMILGNAWQWVYDRYQGRLQGGKDPVEHDNDYGGAGRRRVLRGGCWDFDTTRCRSAYRRRKDPTIRSPAGSLRLALSSSGVYGLGQGETE
jgi:formylglycine-generating enzyme required for sulfatase activity